MVNYSFKMALFSFLDFIIDFYFNNKIDYVLKNKKKSFN